MEKLYAQEIDLETFTDFPAGTRIEGRAKSGNDFYKIDVRIGEDSPKLTAKQHLQNINLLDIDKSSFEVVNILGPGKGDDSLITGSHYLMRVLRDDEIPKVVEFDDGPDLESVKDERPKSWFKRILGK